MSSPRRIAVIGHRGWASSAILGALAASSASVKVLHQADSDVSGVPPQVTTTLVDFADVPALVEALRDIDIVISLVGPPGVEKQQALVKAIPQTNVQLFSPSDLAARYDGQGLSIPVNKAKLEVENAARSACIPITIVLPGNFAEFALSTPAMGIDLENNKLIHTIDSDKQSLNVCTRSYVAAAYVSIFAETPISQLKDRVIGLSELTFSGDDLAQALHARHGRFPTLFRHSREKVDSEIEAALTQGSPFSLPWYCRKIWGTGQQRTMIGQDIWEVQDFPKASLESLVTQGHVESYRELPSFVQEYFRSTFVDG
ncbi:uncharacterized protein F5Z01DRAFT_677491 [Emericellopsis atlantica]|uniref:NmrA-like domain-containing protein n=1 Tax=Emericellopsis atlantica TaxID=2614577 RepID=A0A9P7ZFW8_9HYPO|nr:uncharacterized protein F5Z01DRAFT_677491 [Emericellopsis atlantica]KAG9250820.1 hypothetical protein F5Z01DRAFT_677491 [Emericellopsis atlantica]